MNAELGRNNLFDNIAVAEAGFAMPTEAGIERSDNRVIEDAKNCGFSFRGIVIG